MLECLDLLQEYETINLQVYYTVLIYYISDSAKEGEGQ